MGWLDAFFKGYEGILNAGALLLKRGGINLVAPLVGTDDAPNKWTSVSIAAATASAAGSLSAADYAKLQALAPGAFLPFIEPVVQPEAPATGDLSMIILFASPTSSSKVTTIQGRALGALTADPTNNRTLNIYDVDAANARSSSLFTVSTTSGGTGSWTAAKTIFTWTANYTLPADHSLVAVWSSSAAGALFPGVAYRPT